MSVALSDADLTALQDLIRRSQLRAIEYHQMSARRHDGPQADDVPTDGELSIQVQHRSDEDGFGVRLSASIVLVAGEADVSVAGEYLLETGGAPSARSLQLFTNEVAVMTVYPYLREAVASITGRVFEQPLYLPLVNRGDIAVEVAAANPAD